jgi:iron complex outermembrane receptor protein
MNKFSLEGLLCGGVSALTLMSPAAFAQTAGNDKGSSGGLEEIIVTATKQPENIQDVPISVSAISGRELESRGIQDVAELSKFVPSLRVVQANSVQNSGVFIRGIGGIGTNQGIEPSVGVFLDGVYLPIPGPIQSNLRDISSVEVLRGPQGTLYGRNTPVGAVNIFTREPTQEFDGSVTASYGNYDDIRLSGFVGGGLTDELAGRLSFWGTNQDGFERNLATHDAINSTDQYGIRGRLKWEPNDHLTGNFIAYFTRLDSLCCSPEQLDIPALATPGFLAAANALGYPYLNFSSDDHKVEEYASGETQMDVYGTSATFDWEFEGGGTLTSITSYTGIDNKLTEPAFAGLSRPSITDNRGSLARDSFSQELRFASSQDQRVSYLAGIYLYTDDVENRSRIVFGKGVDRVIYPRFPNPPGLAFSVGDQTDSRFEQTTDSAAAFGQLKWNATDNLHFTVGGRYSYDEKKASSSQTTVPTSSTIFKIVFPNNDLRNLKYTEDKFTYSLSANYDLSDDVMAYLTYATGSKSGGFSGAAVGPGIPIQFDAETSDTIELGLKSLLFDRRLMLNVDVYQMNLNDFQEATVNQSGTAFITDNAGDRRAQGFEMDAQFAPTEGLTFTASAAYLDAEFTDYPAGPCYVGQTPDDPVKKTCNYKGKTPAFSPEWTGSLTGSYRHPLGDGGLVGFLQGDVSYTDSNYTISTLDPRGEQSAVTLLGARIGVESAEGRWRVAAYGKNLTDETYFNSSTNLTLQDLLSGGSIPGFPNAIGAKGYVGWYAPPLTYGIEATINF